MTFKLALTTTTAVGLMMGAVWASQNEAYLGQKGAHNSVACCVDATCCEASGASGAAPRANGSRSRFRRNPEMTEWSSEAVAELRKRYTEITSSQLSRE